MSFVFRGVRPDIENGLSGVLPDRRAMVCLVCVYILFVVDFCVIDCVGVSLEKLKEIIYLEV